MFQNEVPDVSVAYQHHFHKLHELSHCSFERILFILSHCILWLKHQVVGFLVGGKLYALLRIIYMCESKHYVPSCLNKLYCQSATESHNQALVMHHNSEVAKWQ